jgi:hypothetical protein
VINEEAKSKLVISTELRNKKLIDGYKNINKETDKLISQFNRKVDKIQKEEIAVNNLKAKYNELLSFSKTPASLTTMEKELKKNEKEVENLEKQYNNLVNRIMSNNENISFSEKYENTSEVKKLQKENEEFDAQAFNLKKQLIAVREKAEQLKASLKELKVNPGASIEAESLKAKIDLSSESISREKEEATKLIETIQQSNNQRFKGFGIDTSSIGEGFSDLGKKVDKFKNKMSRLVGTAMVFSLIRSGLSSLSKKFISLLKTNDQFSNNLNQIKANLMTAFAPIYNACLPAINSLMNAISKVTGTLAVFISGLFGKTASQAKENAKALYDQADAQTAVNEAQENLASFDKLEVNSDDSSSSSSGTSQGDKIDFSGEIQVSQKLLDILNGIKDFVSNHGQECLSLLGGLVGGIGLFKLGLDGITSLGIGIMIVGIIGLIQSIIDYLQDPSWENFGKIISNIGLIILGLGVVIGSVPLMIAGALVLIVGLIVKYWDDIKAFFMKIIEWIQNHIEDIKRDWGLVGEFFASLVSNILEFFVHTFEDIFNSVKNVLDGIIELVSGVFTGDWEKAWNGVKKIFSGIFQTLFSIAKAPLNAIIALLNSLIAGINICINGLNKIQFDVPDWIPLIGGKKFGFNISPIGKIPMLAQGAVIPANAPFTAILGDQKNGKNLELPESLLRKIIKEESGQKDVVLNATFIMQCETEEIGRAALKGIHLLQTIDGKVYVLN